MSVYALRGATTVEENDREAILEATREMLEELLARNRLAPEDMVSAIFTVTDDLDAEFPAVAARELGLASVPLLCGREIPVPGSMPVGVGGGRDDAGRLVDGVDDALLRARSDRPSVHFD